MANSTPLELERWLDTMIGKRCWGVLVGPAGVHIEFGEKMARPKGEPSGEFSVWLQCAFRINAKKQLLFETAPYPSREELPIISSLIETKIITSSGIDPKNNALRLLLSDEHLFSGYPESEKEERLWIFYDHRREPARYFVVYKDKIEDHAGTRNDE